MIQHVFSITLNYYCVTHVYARVIFVYFENQYYAAFDVLDNIIVLHHLFLSRINESLEQFREMWNNHKLSSENSRTPKQLEYMRHDERARPPGQELGDEEEFDDNSSDNG